MARKSPRAAQDTGREHVPDVFILPVGADAEVEPSRLLLDPYNLRLFEAAPELQESPHDLIGEPPVQDGIWKVLWQDERFLVKRLVDSILNNGFLRHERLIVAPYDGKRYLVLEGNRRLTAVRYLLDLPESRVPQGTLESIRTLPVWILKGESYIADNRASLDEYRRAALTYIGVRHLMGVEKWEAAPRYEFLAQLIEQEGLSFDEVAKRFGRTRAAVVRDYQAHRLYHKFNDHVKSAGVDYQATYNAFAEAARSPSIRKWLGWSSEANDFTDTHSLESFFQYVQKKMPQDDSESEPEDASGSEKSAERVVRNLSRLLRTEDERILTALIIRDYTKAEEIAADRDRGAFVDRLKVYTRDIQEAPVIDLLNHSDEVVQRLVELIQTAVTVKTALEGFRGSSHRPEDK